MSAWQLIDEANLRGVQLGGAKVSELHSNFLINSGNATAEDFELLGWDFVSNPSTHGAFMTPVNESKQVVSEDVCGNYCKAHDLIREIITELS